MRAAANLRELRVSREWLASAQRIAGIGYWQWDAAADRIELSEQMAELLALGDRSAVRCLEELLAFVHAEDREFVRSQIQAASTGVSTGAGEYRLQTLRSHSLVVHQELARPENATDIVLGTVQDVTARRESETHIRRLAFTDELTGLASRAYFNRHLDDVIAASHRHDERFALLFIDLDGFKNVNDRFGHDAGDKVLQVVSRRLQELVRGSDLVARLSGDEFCILVDKISAGYDAADVADRCLEEVSRGVVLDGATVRPGCSIGIAYYPEDGADSRSLLKAADIAMYSAKQGGKRRHARYRPQPAERAQGRS